jgi:uncharacterized damage-inducible protein DinB
MNAKEVLKTSLQSTQNLLNWYVEDLSDADFLARPAPGANHIAWQLGHLIEAEGGLITQFVAPGTYPALPPGFKEKHTKETANAEPPKGFLSKAEYMNLFNQARGVTLAVVDKLTEADLDKPTAGNMAKFAPTFGAILVLISNHTLMHAGQFSVLRRKLGKPVLF